MAVPSDTALFPAISHPKKRAVLAAYAQTGILTKSCASANTDHKLHYYWLRTDPAYVQAFTAAQAMVGDMLEGEAIRRATLETHASDTLLIFLLKGAKPEKYRENVKIDHQVSGEVTLTWSDRLSRAHTALEERRNGHPLPA
jgi:hypothetical protein